MLQITENMKALVLIAGLGVFGGAMTFSGHAAASAGSSIDPETGLICITLQCDFLASRRDKNIVCQKVWPNNDRRESVDLQCRKKVGGRWVPTDEPG